MSLSIRVYGTIDQLPSIDELMELLEENEFEVAMETDDEDGDDWEELHVFESSLDRPVSVLRILEPPVMTSEAEGLLKELTTQNGSEESHVLVETLQNCVNMFGIELSEEMAEDDTALLLSSLLAQIFALKTDGIYCVDNEGFFDDSGELVFELAADE